MSMDYIRNTYDVPAEIGGRVVYTGNGDPQFGTITGGDANYLRIRLDGEVSERRYHPTWKLKCIPPYPTGEVVGPCVCGSWPGGECFRCPVIPAATQQEK